MVLSYGSTQIYSSSMRYPPPSVTASWPAPNYVDPETRGPALVIAEAVILFIALFVLGFRLYARVAIVKKAGWDDWLMIAAAINCCGVTICCVLASELYGWDLHIWDIQQIQLEEGRRISMAVQTIFLFASGLSKLSILASYLRFALLGSWFRRWTYIVMSIVAITLLAFLHLLWTQCDPISGYWDLSNASRACIAEGEPLLAQTIVTASTDFLVYVLPMPALWSVKIPLKQRLGLMLLFGIGSIVIVAACMRAYWIWFVEFATYDVTWYGSTLWIWAVVEVNLGLICGSVPALKPLFWNTTRRNSQDRARSSVYTIPVYHGRTGARYGPRLCTTKSEHSSDLLGRAADPVLRHLNSDDASGLSNRSMEDRKPDTSQASSV